MPFKITLFFTDGTGQAGGGPMPAQHLGGWSESVYAYSDDAALVRSYVLNNGAFGTGLCSARAVLLPQSASIVGQRFAKVFPRSGRSQTLKQLWPGSAGILTDVPQMALNCTIPAATAINVRRFTLRGIPDVCIQYGEYMPTAGYNAALATYFASLGNFHFPGVDNTQVEFSLVSITAGGLATFTLNPTWLPGDLVEFRKVKDPNNVTFRAYSYVTAVGPGINQVTFGGWNAGAATGGAARKYVINLYAMDGAGAVVDRASVRKVGRPFDQYRGRRSKRKVR